MNFLKAHVRGTLLVTFVVVFSYWYYFAVSQAKAQSILEASWRFAIPLVLAAMVGLVGERSGIVNIGIEGQMLTSAFVGFFGAAATGSVVVGMLLGVLTGVLLGGFLAWITVKWQMDQVVAGVVLNIVATGVTSFFYKQGTLLPGRVPKIPLPVLSDIPLIGPVFFNRGFFGLATIIVVLLVQYMLFHTRWGLRTRAIGEYPNAADTAGIDVIKMRLINVSLAGGMAGMAGAFLSMEATGTFARDMTAGRGFTALAIMIFGAWFPYRAMAAALFFGFANALANQLQMDKVVDVPPQMVNLLPYVLTLLVLAVAAGRVRAPAAEGQPFVKGSA